MTSDRHRLVYAGLGLALVALVAALVALWPTGEETPLPDPLEAIFPLPGDLVVRQTAIEIDLPVGYTVELFVDGLRIPANEIGFTEATGISIWQPDAFSVIPEWTPGEHTVFVAWDTAVGRPAPGRFEWSFRVQ